MLASIIALIPKIFTALDSFAKISEFVRAVAAVITQWWISKQTKETRSMIADAAAASAAAETEDELLEANKRWQSVLSRNRFIPK